MSEPGRKPRRSSYDYRCADCGIASLQARSQIDFEIDFFERILGRNPNYPEVLRALADHFSRKKWRRRTLQMLERLAELQPQDAEIAYRLACVHALLKQAAPAVGALRRAISAGYGWVDDLLQDADLDPIRESPEFQRLLRDLQQLSGMP
jgi:tetratricopeptide (TPR) repeat protein